MERIRVKELLKKHSEKVGRLVHRPELAQAIYRDDDAISLAYLTYLLSAWDKGHRLGSFSPSYVLRLGAFFKVRKLEELFEA